MGRETPVRKPVSRPQHLKGWLFRGKGTFQYPCGCWYEEAWQFEISDMVFSLQLLRTARSPYVLGFQFAAFEEITRLKLCLFRSG